jgi:Tfp pilus assembly PilM family ATPase
MSHKELEIAAIAEAKRKIVPTPGPNSIFEYMNLGEVAVDKVAQAEVLVIKTEKSYIEEVLNVFNTLGDTYLSLISPNCYTALNFFPQTSPVYQEDAAFVNLGYDSIDITIAKKGNLNFYRNIKLGLKDIVAHIAAPLNINNEEAEKIILSDGVPAVELDIKDKVRVAEEIMRQKYEVDNAASPAGINLLELRMLWETEIERIAQEVRRTLIYYKEQTKGGRVDNFLFFGGGSKIKGLVNVLADSVGGKCETISPFQRFELSEQQKRDLQEKDTLFASAAAMVLTLLLVGKKERVINFLPPALKKRKLFIKQQVTWITLIVVATSVLFLAWLNILIANNILSRSIERINNEMKKSEDVIKRLDELRSAKDNIEKKSSRVGDIIAKKIDTAAILEEISRIVPSENLIHNFSLDAAAAPGKEATAVKYKMSLDVSCVADYEEAQKISAKLQSMLSASNYFKNVILNFPELERMSLIVIKNNDDVALTEKKERSFSLSADIAKGDKGVAP